MALTIRGGVFTAIGNQLLPVFFPDTDNIVATSFNDSTSTELELPNSPVLRVHADEACFIKFGDASADANSSSLPFDAGAEIMAIAKEYTHISVLGNAASGTLTIVPMKQ